MKRVSDSTILFVLIGVSFIGIALHRTAALAPAERIILDTVMPLQRTIDGALDRVNNVVETARHLDGLQAENEALRELVDQLMIENVKLTDETREVHSLREELQFKRANSSFDIRAADILGGEVVGHEPSNPLAYIVVDVGDNDGVKKGMPVTRAGALVGQVVRVGQHASRVLLIIDPTSKINARIQSSGATGIVTGSVDGALRLTRIPPDVEVHVGDIVITSGYGGNFPRRLVIGQVTQVHKRDVDPFQTADLAPAADFSALEIVSVITDFQPTDYDDVR
ncbi:MAG: rod shape-determining protein MreC [Anaerolineae bacterium]